MQIPKFDQQRYKLVKEMIMSCKPSERTACDLGSGQYPITDNILFMKRTTVDIDSSNNPDIITDLSSRIPFTKESVGIVVACELIEHMFDTGKFLKEVSRVLVPNGDFILSTPNICSLRYRLAFLLGRVPAHASKGAVNGHVRDFNLDELAGLLKSNGFLLKETKTDGVWTGNNRIPSPITLGDSIIVRCVKDSILARCVNYGQLY